MIYMVENHQFGVFINEIADMHRLRYRVFKERLNWDVTVSGDMEIDEYDALSPVYLLYCDARGRVEGSVRLLPTTGPNMLRNSFPMLLASNAPPESACIWEASRFALDMQPNSQKTRHGLSASTFELFSAMVEFGLARNLTDIVAVVDIRMERILRRAGWSLRRIHDSQRIGNTQTVAGLLEVSSKAWNGIQVQGGLDGPVLAEPIRLKETA
jgi:acyl homoserine lactone synthase